MPPSPGSEQAGSLSDSQRIIFIQLAEAHRHEGLLDDALRILRAGLAREESVPGRMALARLLVERGELDEALVELERVEAAAPGDPEALELRTAILLRRRERPVRGAEPDPGEGEPQAAPGLAGPASPTLAALYAAQGYGERAQAMTRTQAPSPRVEESRAVTALRAFLAAARRSREAGTP